MTEQQRYDIVRGYPGFELRRYPAHVVADVEIHGSFEGAGNAGFRPLVGYISRGGVSMTAPVLQEATEDVDDVTNASAYRVSFVMPAGASVSSLPVPADARVTVRDVPEELAAVARFSGRWTRESFRRHADELMQAVAEAPLRSSGRLRWARFDPPWTPWFRRRNEVAIPVHESGSG